MHNALSKRIILCWLRFQFIENIHHAPSLRCWTHWPIQYSMWSFSLSLVFRSPSQSNTVFGCIDCWLEQKSHDKRQYSKMTFLLFRNWKKFNRPIALCEHFVRFVCVWFQDSFYATIDPISYTKTELKVHSEVEIGIFRAFSGLSWNCIWMHAFRVKSNLKGVGCQSFRLKLPISIRNA